MARKLVIGLDLGTTSVKAVMFNVRGQLIAEAEKLVTTYYPQPNWVEQDPHEIERSSVSVMREVIEKAHVRDGELLAVGLSCAMHSLICVDENGEPLSNMIIWADGRSSEQAERLLQSNGKDIFQRTGTPIHPMSPLPKLMWMRDTNYMPYRKAVYFMTMKEYLIWKWFGKRVVDYSMASATGLYNLEKRDWDEAALAVAGIKREQLSEIKAPTEVLPKLDAVIAKEIGIAPKIPFVIGAADGQLASLGSGAISPGEIAISAGTSGAVRQFVKGAPINVSQATFTYTFTADTSIIGGATNNGGIVLQWLKDLLAFRGSYAELLQGAEQVAVGAEGILFLPYVNGERAPLWNSRAKGNFYGLSIGHKREHLVRSVLEGITYNIYDISKSLEALAGVPKKISVNGGLTQASLWVQILADVFGQAIHVSDTHHNAAWGAAWIALVGIGHVDSFEAIKQNLLVEKVIQPDWQNHKRYAEIYQKYHHM